MSLPTELIDVHTHTFTATMIPAKAILEKTFGIPKLIAVPVADFVVALGIIAEKHESAGNSATAGIIAALQNASIAPEGPSLVQALESLATEVAELSMKADLDDDLLRRLVDIPGGEVELAIPTTFEKSFATKLAQHVIEMLKAELQRAESTLGSYLDDLLFVFHLILTQQDNVRAAQKAYGEYGISSAPMNVLMMDMEKAYNENPSHPWTYQVEMNKQIQSMANVSGFIAFDPRRDDSLTIIESVMDTYNFRGVKVYPGLDYKPNDTRYPSLQNLYEYCVENDVPILTHCTPQGWEVTKGVSGLNSNPMYWEPILEQYPTLRLCYGHAGGGGAIVNSVDYPGWDWDWTAPSPSENNYAKQVLSHCNKYENVYCDFSYYDQLIIDADRDAQRAQLIANLTQALTNTPAFGRKIMYGSDYHMPSLTHRVKEYFELWSSIFDHNVLKDFKDVFFCDNAKCFLRLA